MRRLRRRGAAAAAQPPLRGMSLFQSRRNLAVLFLVCTKM